MCLPLKHANKHISYCIIYDATGMIGREKRTLIVGDKFQ